MTNEFGPRIVTDGLVLALDAADINSFDEYENLLTYSEDFGNAAWNKSDSSISDTVVIAPDGKSTADKLQENTANNYHLIYQSRTGSNETVTFSIFCKAAERTKVFIQLTNFLNATAQAVYDLSTGIAGAPSPSNLDYSNNSSSIIAYPNGWYRCILTTTKGSVNTVNNVLINTVDGSGNGTYTGNLGSGFYIWGAQLERGSSANNYYQTTTTTKTRGTTWIDLTGNSNNGTLTNGPTYNISNGGSIVFDGTNDYITGTLPLISSNATIESIFKLNNTSGLKNIFTQGQNAVTFSCGMVVSETNLKFRNNGNEYSFSSPPTLSANQWYHCAFSIDSNGTTGYVNAVSIGTTTEKITTNNVTTYNISRRPGTDSEFFNGNIAICRIYNKALTSIEVQQNFNATRSRFGI